MGRWAAMLVLVVGCSGADPSPLTKGAIPDGGCAQDALTECFEGEQARCAEPSDADSLVLVGVKECNACGYYGPCVYHDAASPLVSDSGDAALPETQCTSTEECHDSYLLDADTCVFADAGSGARGYCKQLPASEDRSDGGI